MKNLILVVSMMVMAAVSFNASADDFDDANAKRCADNKVTEKHSRPYIDMPIQYLVCFHKPEEMTMVSETRITHIILVGDFLSGKLYSFINHKLYSITNAGY